MADRFPLIANPTTKQIEELASGDNLNLQNSGIVGATTVTANTFIGILQGNATTASILNDASNITAGTINPARLSGFYPISVNDSNTLNDAANITAGTISSSRLSGSYSIDIIGTAYTATTLADAANIVTGTISPDRLVGTYNINVSSASTASNLAPGLYTVDITGNAATATTSTNVSGGGNISGANLNISGNTTLGITTVTNLTVSNVASFGGIVTATAFSTGISSENIGITTGLISGPNVIYITPYTVGVSTGSVRIVGDLIVEGTTITNVQEILQASSKTIGVAVSETNNTLLDGAGITIGSTSIQKTILWNYGSSSIKSSENFNIASGKVYQINDLQILSSTELANSVVTSGLTTVGSLKQLVVSNTLSTDLVRITQTGTGNALVVEDSANPDSTPFVVTASGSVGLGTTNPQYKLDVDGDINFTGSFYQNSSPFVASRWTSGIGDDIYRLNGNVGIGTTNSTSKLHVVGDALITGVTTSTDYNTISDVNLKTNIRRIENSLEKVVQIRGVTFNWKSTNKSSAGVIAQEVENVLPEIINGDDIKTVNYNGVIATLVEAVKELKAENDLLKDKLEKVYKEVFG